MTLHVENISLLTSTADDLKARLGSMGKLIEGSMHMSRGFKSPLSNGFFSFQGELSPLPFLYTVTHLGLVGRSGFSALLCRAVG